MRLRSRLALWLSLVVAILHPLSAAASSPSLTLPQWQQISGFSASCTAAYNTPIPGCTPADFANNNPCSSSCIRGLQSITALLNSNCQGTEADPSTLIGLFFQGQGVKALCPNAGSSGGSQSTSSAVVDSSSAISSSPITTSASTSSTSSNVVGTSSLASETTASGSSSSASQTAAASMAASSISLITQTGNGFTKTVINQGTATVLTSKADQSASANPDAFGGGGSPFEISGVSHTVVNLLWVVCGTAVYMVAAWLI